MRRFVEAALLAALAVLALRTALEDETGEDLWWHLATGRWIVEHGMIPTRDMFSWTYPGARWVNQEWLSQVLFFGLFDRGGGTELALFKIVVVAALFPFVAWIGLRRSGSLVFAVVGAGPAAIVCRPYLDIRPQLFTFVGTLVLLAVVDAYRRGARARILVLLPVTLALWTNLHASFLYGLGLLAAMAAAESVKAVWSIPDAPMTRRRALVLVAAVVVAGVACLANHEGVGAFTFPFTLATGEGRMWRTGVPLTMGAADDHVWRSAIIEWRPPVLFPEGPLNPSSFGWFLVFGIALAVVALAVAPRRFDVTDALVAGVTGAMALAARRFVPLFAFVSAPWAARNLGTLWTRWSSGEPGGEIARPGRALGVAVAAVGLACVTLAVAIPDASRMYAHGLFPGMVREWAFPEDAVEFLRLNPLPRRTFHVYSWGGYLLWKLPEGGVFIDPRAQTVYPATFFREQMVAEYGQPGWDDILDRHGVGLVLWPSEGFAGELYGNLLRRLARSPSWQRIYDDGHATVFAHVTRGRVWVAKYQSFRLRYPERPGAQLFLGNAYLQAGSFERARVHMQTVLGRFPSARLAARRTADRFLAQTRTTGTAPSWFGLAFSRDVLEDGAGAAEAYRTALAKGLTDARAAYARDALVRLSSPHRAD